MQTHAALDLGTPSPVPHRAGTGACRSCPAAPPGAPPLPRFRLRMTNFCTAPTAREMERGEHAGGGPKCAHGDPPFPRSPSLWCPIRGELCQAGSPSPLPVPLSPSGRPGDLARARRSEPGGSWLGGAQLWLVARPPLKKRLTRVLERCKPGGAPRAPWPSGFSFFRFSSAGREGRIEGIGGGTEWRRAPWGGCSTPVPTGHGEVALGARDGLPRPAEGQQQRRFG